MTYDVKSRVHFPRMREIFFTKENWELAGDGDFTGTFHLFKGGHDLTGTFTQRGRRRLRLSVSAAVRLASLDAEGVRGHRRRVEALRRRRALRLFDQAARARRAARPRASTRRTRTSISPSSPTSTSCAGCASPDARSGENLLEWPIGRFHENRGERPRHGDAAARRAADDRRLCRRRRRDHAAARVGTVRAAAAAAPPADRRRADLPVRRRERVELEAGGSPPSRRTSRSRGRRPGATSRDIRFHVTSGDWQESDQVLAGILTDFGSPTRAGDRSAGAASSTA